MQRNRAGFGVFELLVIIAIIAFLLALLIPAVAKVREAASRTQSVNNIKQVSLALHSCNDVNRKLPPAFSSFGPIQFPASLHVHLLPYIEQGPLFTAILNKKNDAKLLEQRIPTYVAVDDRSHLGNAEGIQNYAANLRVFTDKGIQMAANHQKNMPALGAEEKANVGIPRTFVDGTSNTMVFATKYAVCGDEGGSKYGSRVNSKYAAFYGQNGAKEKASADNPASTFQLAPDQEQCLTSPLMAQSFTKAGILVGLADASVRTVTPRVSAETWNHALQPNDGNVLGKDWD